MRGIPSLITDIRKKVVVEVARMAYEGNGYEAANELPHRERVPPYRGEARLIKVLSAELKKLRPQHLRKETRYFRTGFLFVC